MRVLCYYFFNSDDQRLFFSLVLSLVAYIFSQSFLFPLYFTWHSVSLGVMLNDQSHFDTPDYFYSPWGLLFLCPGLHHLGGETRLDQFFMESETKAFPSLILSRVGSTLRNHDKAPSIWLRSFHMFDVFIGDTSSTATFQKINHVLYPQCHPWNDQHTHTIELNPMVRLFFIPYLWNILFISTSITSSLHLLYIW